MTGLAAPSATASPIKAVVALLVATQYGNPQRAASSDSNSAIFWEHECNAAARDGKWKLVCTGRDGPWEFYDLESDRTEMRNIARTHSETVNNLAAQWEAWAERSLVEPYPRESRKMNTKKTLPSLPRR